MKKKYYLYLLVFFAGCAKPDFIQEVFIENQSNQDLFFIPFTDDSSMVAADSIRVVPGELKKIFTINYGKVNSTPRCIGTANLYDLQTVSGDSITKNFQNEGAWNSILTDKNSSQECTFSITNDDIVQ